MARFLKYQIPNPVRHDDPDLVIDFDTVEIFYKGDKLSCKRFFEFKCKCGKICKTTKNNIRNKKSKFFCRSCSTIESWKDTSYRSVRELKIRELGSSECSRERGRNQFKQMWQDPIRRAEAIRRTHTADIRKRQSETRKKNLLEDRTAFDKLIENGIKNRWGEHVDFIDTSGKKIHLKSRGEHRIAKILELHFLDFEYEPKGFLIQSLNSAYYPDFWVKDFDLWIEVKYSTKQDILKTLEFAKQEKSIKIALLFHKDINDLEKLCESRASKMTKLDMLEILQSKIITIS